MLNLFKQIPGVGVAWKLVKYYSVFYAVKTYMIPVDLVILSGSSMEPTLFNRDLVLVEKISVYQRRLKSGDIIIARNPFKPHTYICKRISRYLKASHRLAPAGFVYLTGDNSENSNDSRFYGAIPYGLVESRVILKILPLRDFQYFEKAQ